MKFANFSYHLNRKRNSAFKEERFLPISILGPGSNAMIKISGAEIQYADGTILKLGESNFTLLKELLPVFQK